MEKWSNYKQLAKVVIPLQNLKLSFSGYANQCFVKYEFMIDCKWDVFLRFLSSHQTN